MSINTEDLFVFNNQVGSVEALFGTDADTAAQARAEYVYSVYGEVMMKSGDLADKNNITYSTRYQEANTGLISYTYRHYSPRLKKWLSKDPIAENGGINLYQMTANDPVNYWDMLGYAYQACPIYIFIGHSALKTDGTPRTDSGVGKAINDTIKDIQNSSNTPPIYAIGGVSCFSKTTNTLAGKHNIPNNLRNDNELDFLHHKYFSFLDSLLNMFVPADQSLYKQALREIKAAEEFASSMCKKPPRCCDSFRINIKIVSDDFFRLKNLLPFEEKEITCE